MATYITNIQARYWITGVEEGTKVLFSWEWRLVQRVNSRSKQGSTNNLWCSTKSQMVRQAALSCPYKHVTSIAIKTLATTDQSINWFWVRKYNNPLCSQDRLIPTTSRPTKEVLSHKLCELPTYCTYTDTRSPKINLESFHFWKQNSLIERLSDGAVIPKKQNWEDKRCGMYDEESAMAKAIKPSLPKADVHTHTAGPIQMEATTGSDVSVN
jgi:hypothetical protein